MNLYTCYHALQHVVYYIQVEKALAKETGNIHYPLEDLTAIMILVSPPTNPTEPFRSRSSSIIYPVCKCHASEHVKRGRQAVKSS